MMDWRRGGVEYEIEMEEIREDDADVRRTGDYSLRRERGGGDMRGEVVEVEERKTWRWLSMLSLDCKMHFRRCFLTNGLAHVRKVVCEKTTLPA